MCRSVLRRRTLGRTCTKACAAARARVAFSISSALSKVSLHCHANAQEFIKSINGNRDSVWESATGSGGEEVHSEYLGWGWGIGGQVTVGAHWSTLGDMNPCIFPTRFLGEVPKQPKLQVTKLVYRVVVSPLRLHAALTDLIPLNSKVPKQPTRQEAKECRRKQAFRVCCCIVWYGTHLISLETLSAFALSTVSTARITSSLNDTRLFLLWVGGNRDALWGAWHAHTDESEVSGPNCMFGVVPVVLLLLLPLLAM